MAAPPRTQAHDCVRRLCGWAWAGPRVMGGREPRGDAPARRGTRSVNRGQEATGGAIEGEASVLPGRALTQSRESLHVAPDRSGIRLVLLGQCVRLSRLLLGQIQSCGDP